MKLETIHDITHEPGWRHYDHCDVKTFGDAPDRLHIVVAEEGFVIEPETTVYGRIEPEDLHAASELVRRLEAAWKR